MTHQPPMGTPSAGDPPASCLRCKTVYLKIVKASPEITFYRCPRCTRHYAGTPGAGLVDRWGSPVSRALYGVIYEPDAIPHAPRIAGELARGRTGPAIEALAREIQLELDEPTQRVAEILDMATPKTEEHLRKFLGLVAEQLRRVAMQGPPR